MKQILELLSWQFYILLSCTVYLSNAYDYKTFFLEDPDLCSQAGLKTGKIKLDRSKFQAAKVINKRNQNDFICNFKVKPSNKADGVIAVIQELSLRENVVTGECIDYIQFKSEQGLPSRKYCGRFNAELKMDTLFAPENVVDTVEENTFLSDPGDGIEVKVYISRNIYMDEHESSSTVDIVFTLFTPCRIKPRNFKPCLESGNICINEIYFNDDVINCPYVDCVDEGSCRLESVTEKLSLGSKVLISSVSSLLISFIVFIICIYLCRKYKKLCFSEHFATQHPAEESQAPRVIEMNEQPSQASGSPGPRVRRVDKDLPPSYDSLFPDR